MQNEPVEIRAGQLLREHHCTLSTAESCTGGLIGHLITNISGSSEYFKGGIIAYDNAIKQAVLKVRESTLRDHGAVSEQVAAEMAINARTILQTDYALSVTGIAGPGGGTETKPVGLTYIGLAGPKSLLVVRRCVWDGDRVGNKESSANEALSLLVEALTGSL